jgi:hypothetical protein
MKRSGCKKSTLNVTPLAAVSNILYRYLNTAVDCNFISLHVYIYIYIYISYMHVPDDKLLKAEISWKYINVCTKIYHKTGNVRTNVTLRRVRATFVAVR